MVESVFAFDGIMITMVTISKLTINAVIVIALTILAIGEINEFIGIKLVMLIHLNLRCLS